MLLAFMPAVCALYAQDSAKIQKEKQLAAAIKSLIYAKRFKFLAQSATTMSGVMRQLTDGSNVRVNNDTIVSELPFYGRSFNPTYGSTSESGVEFTSTDFEYSISEAKKGGWNITIIPKKVRDVSKMFMYVSESGYINLNVSSNTRQTVNYYGIIQELSSD